MMRASENHRSSLQALARLYGIQSWYIDALNKRHYPGDDTLLALLKEMGAGLERPSEAADALRREQNERAARMVEPVQVSWSNEPPVFRFALPDFIEGSTAIKITLSGDNGYTGEVQGQKSNIPDEGRRETDGGAMRLYSMALPPDLPDGAYECSLEVGGTANQSTLLRAPLRAADLSPQVTQHRRALFLPTYAIRSDRSWGMGDYSDLRGLISVASRTGAGTAATLPLLPVFEEDPSPYSPVSRLLWNELYVDPRAAPEFAECDAARRITESAGFRDSVASLQRGEFVDYPAQFRLRRPVLQAMADYAESSPQLKQELEKFATEHPYAMQYAQFRAACEKMGHPWQSWGAAARDAGKGTLRRGEHFDDASYTYHLNAQRLAFQQISGLSGSGGTDSTVTFIDMPLGVRRDGFDAWLNPDLFAGSVSAGSPPDIFFSGGQDWGFPPMMPEALRKDGYRYFRDSLRHFTQAAGMLRIDHVMGLHRLYWVPPGMDASKGAYVRYPADEFYALLTLESQRSGAAVVGEDLGTVPHYVGPAMRRHNFQRMYVVYFNVRTEDEPDLLKPGPGMVAYINTHDMPSFASFLQGLDIDYRKERDQMKAADVRAEKRDREAMVAAIRKRLIADGQLKRGDDSHESLLRALVRWLEQTNASTVIINLEDLWLDPRPQNTPGTSTELPNWQGRAQKDLREVEELLRSL